MNECRAGLRGLAAAIAIFASVSVCFAEMPSKVADAGDANTSNSVQTDAQGSPLPPAQQQLSGAQDANLAQIRQAVDSWEANIRTRDPDYDRKALTVQRLARALIQERGAPRDPQAAVALVQEAYDQAARDVLREPVSPPLQAPPQPSAAAAQTQSNPAGTGAAPQPQGADDLVPIGRLTPSQMARLTQPQAQPLPAQAQSQAPTAPAQPSGLTPTGINLDQEPQQETLDEPLVRVALAVLLLIAVLGIIVGTRLARKWRKGHGTRLNKRTLGRVLAIVVVTAVSAKVFETVASDIFDIAKASSVNSCPVDPGGLPSLDGPTCYVPNTDAATNAVTFLGAIFGFWLTYTGRLARVFRKV